MNRYLIFLWKDGEQKGGMKDFLISYDEQKVADEFARRLVESHRSKKEDYTAHVFDLIECRIVSESHCIKDLFSKGIVVEMRPTVQILERKDSNV